ncbi:MULTISPECIES: E3 binding domain-containing protein [unclassified Halomonas]|uniref:E3 binding domain-containing protein n=1 Tax=unclassified Halomonas TaxID=2609666 RepID=UPI0026467A7D|nr:MULTISPECIES: E3 binding domain-containing protein [unclassified Halomonas]
MQKSRCENQKGRRVHATPLVKMLARELGVNLADVTPSGPEGRVLKRDVYVFVRRVMGEHARSVARRGA